MPDLHHMHMYLHDSPPGLVVQAIHQVLEYIRTGMMKDRLGFAQNLAVMLNRVSMQQPAPHPTANSTSEAVQNGVHPSVIATNQELEACAASCQKSLPRMHDINRSWCS